MNDDHISDLELLDYLAGRLDPPRKAEVDARLARSDAERQRLDALRRTWRLMGEWKVDASGSDLRARVARRIGRRRRPVLLPPSINWQAVRRVAATWIVAIGLGVLGGRMLLPAEPPSQNGQTQAETEDEVAQTLYLDAVGSGGSAGVAEALLDDENGEEGQP